MMQRTRSDRQVSKLFQYDFRGKKPWTIEEDNLLRELTDKNGTGNWTSIAQNFVDRSGKQCRERWHNHLNPGIKKGDWTPEEDEIIVRMQQIWGNQWAKITTMLPGRTDNAVKNRFHATLRATKGKKTSSGRNIQMKYDMDDDDFDSTSVDVSDDSDLPVAQPCSIIIEGDVKYAANYNGVSLKDLNSMLPSAQASARVSNGQIMGRVIQSEGHFCSNIVADLSDRDDDFDISPSPINESIGSIETVQMDLENSIFTENFVPLEIDIDGLRDWMGDDMDCDDNIQEEDSNSCFSKIKNEARGFMNNGWKNDDKQSGNRTWGGFTTSLCDRGFSPSDNDRQSFHNSQFKDSAGNFCSSLSYNYLSGR